MHECKSNILIKRFGGEQMRTNFYVNQKRFFNPFTFCEKKRYIVKDLMFSGWIVHVYTWVREFPIYLWLGKMHKYLLQREFRGIQQNKRKGGSVLVLFWKGFCIKINHIWERTIYHFPSSYHTLVPFYFVILYDSLEYFLFVMLSIF